MCLGMLQSQCHAPWWRRQAQALLKAAVLPKGHQASSGAGGLATHRPHPERTARAREPGHGLTVTHIVLPRRHRSGSARPPPQHVALRPATDIMITFTHGHNTHSASKGSMASTRAAATALAPRRSCLASARAHERARVTRNLCVSSRAFVWQCVVCKERCKCCRSESPPTEVTLAYRARSAKRVYGAARTRACASQVPSETWAGSSLREKGCVARPSASPSACVGGCAGKSMRFPSGMLGRGIDPSRRGTQPRA